MADISGEKLQEQTEQALTNCERIIEAAKQAFALGNLCPRRERFCNPEPK